jgi:hypothetical protein
MILHNKEGSQLCTILFFYIRLEGTVSGVKIKNPKIVALTTTNLSKGFRGPYDQTLGLSPLYQKSDLCIPRNETA